MNLITLATCSLNQWALDFSGNLDRISESIRIAKERGAVYRLGPELEIPGYGCQDHFLEGDTLQHSWEVLAEIIDSDLTDGIICDIGLPVMHKNVRYNCRALVYNRQILLIRPKMILANDGNYRETRWFVPWQRPREVEPFSLPVTIRQLTGQDFVPFGDAAIDALDATFAVETCEELFAPGSPHTYLSLDGVEIIANGSGSHHQLRKLHQRIDLIQEATAKNGGVYLYANQQGCDGGRLYFDGSALIAVNGLIIEQGSQFSLHDVEVISATVDLDAVRSFRGAVASRMVQASHSPAVPRVQLPVSLTHNRSAKIEITDPQAVHYHTPEEEIAYGPACWLWDYLRRSGLSGFFLPLSGGSDSGAVAALVGSMCQLVIKEMRAGNRQVIDDVRRIVGEDFDGDAAALAHQLLHTAYLGTANSSAATRSRAQALAEEIGAYHLTLKIDLVVDALLKVFVLATGKTPRFKTSGGSNSENLALQNIQARSRMVLAYLFAQLLPWVRGRSGGLLVLGTANVDEALRGYMTKYDNSSADINPIGGISKIDLRRFLSWAADNLGYPSLHDLVTAVPTAELEPITDSYTQTDEDDMGMTYAELSVFGRLRKIRRCGPLEMYDILVHEWDHLSPREVADKVKRFFYYYSVNRHKMTVLTPAYHAENYSPDDNRFDLRPFLYNVRWEWQFRKIEERVKS